MQSAELTTFMEKLGLRETAAANLLEPVLSDKYFLLPTVAGKPSPSFELLRYVEEEEPIEFELVPWRISCYKVSDVITALNEIHFVALHAAEDFQLGTDFLLWHQYAQALKGIIAKDQYIPALKYRVLPQAVVKGKKTKKAQNEPIFELHPAWEFLSNTYETLIQRYAAAMPGVCAAGLNSADGVALFDKASLLRHFSECLLRTIVTGTPFTAKFDQQIANTI
ncbi:MAG TPA: hypothetical protein VN729_09080, partial [Ktedonobacteraceae bacterium]|nr:hypothetical protein [Ktedonobacteraceae bacterium]